MTIIVYSIVALSLAVSLGVTWLLSRQALAGLAVDDHEAHRKAGQKKAISRLGGVGVAVGCVVGVVFLIGGRTVSLAEWWPAMTTAALMFLLGLIDDIRPLGAKIKLLGQVLIALLAYGCGLSVETISWFGSGTGLSIGEVSFLATIAWLVAIPNIVNLIDGVDGLAGGLGVFVMVCLAAVTLTSGKSDAGYLCLVMMAALLGFLVFNFPPAKIYMGDAGAYLIGGFIASVSLESSQKGSVAAMFLVVMVAMGLPILDTIFALIRRGLRGSPLFRADAKHIHHRMLELGFSKRRTLLLMYLICLLFSLAGLSIFWSQGLSLPIVIATVFILAMGGARTLGFVRQWSTFHHQLSSVKRCRSQVQRAHRLGDLLLGEVDHCKTSDEFWSLFRSIASRLGFEMPEDHGGKIVDETNCSVVISMQGSPDLVLRYPKARAEDENWWALADSLYPAFTTAIRKWGIDGQAVNISHRVVRFHPEGGVVVRDPEGLRS